MSVGVVLLAAGKGTRMNSKRQKILHEVGGKPMVQHVFEASMAVTNRPPVIVVGAGETGVQTLLGEQADYVVQEEQLGTGHATQMARSCLQGQVTQLLVTYGDMPLLMAETLHALVQKQQTLGATIMMTSVMGDPSSSFGRVVRDANGRLTEILEVANAKRRDNAEALLAIRELNVGVYIFDADWLWQNIANLPVRQARNGQEYYLTDMVAMAVQQGLLVESHIIDDADECLGAGTRAELVAVEQAFQQRRRKYWLDRGVTLIDPDSIWIDDGVTIGQDTIIWPNSFLQGTTTIGQDCTIGPNAIVRNCTIKDGVILEQGLFSGVANLSEIE